jgi:DNA-binding beta-propeller fold protein YncE
VAAQASRAGRFWQVAAAWGGRVNTMLLRLVSYISLPSDTRPALYGRPTLHLDGGRLYIPMIEDDALGVVDCNQNTYLHAIPNLPSVSAVVASEEAATLLAGVRGTGEVVVIAAGPDHVAAVLAVGGGPEELAYDSSRGHLLVTFASPRKDTEYFSVAVVDVGQKVIIGNVRVPGSTREVRYDRQSDMFYVVVADPAQIVVLAADSPTRVAHAFDVAGRGLRSIAVGPQGTRLFCACDDSTLITVDRRSGRMLSSTETSGQPDTILYDPVRTHLYAAMKERGVVEVFDTVLMTSLGTVETESGTDRLAFDPVRRRLYALLPQSRRVAVYEDGE